MKTSQHVLVLAAVGSVLSLTMGCSSLKTRDSAIQESLAKRVVIENSNGTTSRPDWLTTTTIFEEKDSHLFFTGFFAGQGSNRLSTCYRLAEADIQVRMAQEISQRVKSELLQMAEGMSEQVEPAVLDSLLVEAKAQIDGLRLTDRFYERALVNGSERVDCFARARISLGDFMRAKQGLTRSLADQRPEIRAILNARQKDFAQKDASQKDTVEKDEKQ